MAIIRQITVTQWIFLATTAAAGARGVVNQQLLAAATISSDEATTTMMAMAADQQQQQQRQQQQQQQRAMLPLPSASTLSLLSNRATKLAFTIFHGVSHRVSHAFAFSRLTSDINEDGAHASTKEGDDTVQQQQRRALVDIEEDETGTILFETVTNSDDTNTNTITAQDVLHTLLTNDDHHGAATATSLGYTLQIRNPTTSTHGCLAAYTNGNLLFADTTSDTSSNTFPNEGIILSTGNPLDIYDSHSHSHHDGATTTTTTTSDSDTSTNWYQGGDANLNSMLQQSGKTQLGYTYDACSIEFEFKCNNNKGEQQQQEQARFFLEYNFASEEYYETSSALFGDVFGVFLNGDNIATIDVPVPSPSSSSSSSMEGSSRGSITKADIPVPVGIDTINQYTNSEYFVGNDISSERGISYPNVEADGFTLRLTASGIVNATSTSSPSSTVDNNDDEGWNTMKIVIADVGDRLLDSWLLLAGGSLRCEPLNINEVCDVLYTRSVYYWIVGMKSLS